MFAEDGAMRRAHLIVAAVTALAALGAAARGDDVSVPLEAGVYAEEVAGDLDRAIEVYRRIVEDAEAHYRLGQCYLTKGEEGQAREQFAQLASRYPDQESLARAAERELVKLQPPPAPGGVIDIDTGRDKALYYEVVYP